MTAVLTSKILKQMCDANKTNYNYSGVLISIPLLTITGWSESRPHSSKTGIISNACPHFITTIQTKSDVAGECCHGCKVIRRGHVRRERHTSIQRWRQTLTSNSCEDLEKAL